MWLRQLLEVLDSSPDITSWQKTANLLTIKFAKTGVTECWALDDADYNRVNRVYRVPDNPLKPEKPKIFRQFETNPYYQDEYAILKEHFIIQQRSIQQSGFVNLRIAIHNLAHALYQQGWKDLAYTEEILFKDYKALLESDTSIHRSSRIRFEIFKTKSVGFRLLYHFTPIDRGAARNWRSMSKLVTAIDRMAMGGVRDITREKIVKALNPISFISPNYYRAIFKEWFDTQGMNIIDFYPSSGSRSLAVGLCGGHYFHNQPIFQEPFSNLAEWCNLPRVNLDDGRRYDLAFVSRQKPLDREQAEDRIRKYKDRAALLAVMVKKSDRAYFVEHHKPKRVLRIAKGICGTANDDNYLLLIGQT